MKSVYRLSVIAGLLSPLLFFSGCSSTPAAAGSGQQPAAEAAASLPPGPTSGEQTHLAQVLRAQDNANTASPPRPASHSNSAASPGSAVPPAAASAAVTHRVATSSAPSVSPQYAVAGMVGQVNGQAIYADHVFKPMSDQLKALAKQLPSDQFMQRAQQLIENRLQQMVADRLILGRASRDLSKGERQGLDHYVHEHREMLIRKYGRGSLPIAKQQIKQQTGKSLQQTIEDFRDEVIVQRYLHQKLVPRINVTRRDVRRYYHNHYQQFHPPTERTIRLIRVITDASAKKIEQMLDAGTPFKTVAANPLNSYNADDAGKMGEQQGDHVFQGALNDAMLKLKAGQYAGPIDFKGGKWFIYIEKMTTPKSQSLRDVQLQIERQLRDEQFRMLSAQYRQKLFANGSYNNIDQMTKQLLQIAIDRYAVSPS